ncbi:MAG: NAD-binding protein, partial [Pseudomonadota bacterium]
INFGLMWANILTVIGLTIGLIALKAAILWGLAIVFRLRGADRWLFTLGLAQAGEFGFVLLSFTVANNVIPPDLAEQLLLVVALSMLLTPLLFIVYEKLVAPRFTEAQERREADDIDTEGEIVIAGHGRFGGVINRILTSAGFNTTVLDFKSEQLDMIRAFDIKVFFGDATRPDMLHAAGIERARMLVIAIDDKENITELVRYVVAAHPHVHVIARAVDRRHVYELWAAGCRDIIRENFDGAVRAGRSALEALGLHPYDAERQVRGFVANDKAQLRDVAGLFDPDIPIHENLPYIERTKEYIARTEDMMRGHSASFASRIERGWVPPTVEDVEAEERQAGGETEG